MRNVAVRNRISRLGLRSYCDIHDAVFEAGPEWSEPPATLVKNIACNPPVPHGTFYADGKPDWVQLASGLWVMDFNGTDAYVNCGTDASLNPNKMSIELWMKAVNANVGSYRGLVQRDAWDSSYQFFVDGMNIRWFIKNSSDATAIAAGTGENTTTWLHIAGTFDGSLGSDNLKLYKNASVIATANLSGTVKSSAGNTIIGRSTLIDSFWEGKMALVRIYRYPRTQSQIAAGFEAERGWFGV